MAGDPSATMAYNVWSSRSCERSEQFARGPVRSAPLILLPGALPHEGTNEGKARMFPERNEWLSTGAKRRSGTATWSYAQ
jgi:hypothetical protein